MQPHVKGIQVVHPRRGQPYARYSPAFRQKIEDIVARWPEDPNRAYMQAAFERSRKQCLEMATQDRRFFGGRRETIGRELGKMLRNAHRSKPPIIRRRDDLLFRLIRKGGGGCMGRAMRVANRVHGIRA